MLHGDEYQAGINCTLRTFKRKNKHLIFIYIPTKYNKLTRTSAKYNLSIVEERL
jgi:hypothetical protein